MMKLALLLLEKDRAGTGLRRAAAERPNGQYLMGLAHAYADRLEGHYAEAARGLENLRRSQPDDPESIALLVETYSQWADAPPQ